MFEEGYNIGSKFEISAKTIPEGCNIGNKNRSQSHQIPEGCNNVHDVASLRDLRFTLISSFSTNLASL